MVPANQPACCWSLPRNWSTEFATRSPRRRSLRDWNWLIGGTCPRGLPSAQEALAGSLSPLELKAW